MQHSTQATGCPESFLSFTAEKQKNIFYFFPALTASQSHGQTLSDTGASKAETQNKKGLVDCKRSKASKQSLFI